MARSRRKKKSRLPRRIKSSKLTYLKRREERLRSELKEHVRALRADLRFIKSHPWSLTKMSALIRLFNDCERGYRMVTEHNRAKGLVKQYWTWQRKKREGVRNK